MPPASINAPTLTSISIRGLLHLLLMLHGGLLVVVRLVWRGGPLGDVGVVVVAELDLAPASGGRQHAGRGLVSEEVAHVLLPAWPRVVVGKASMAHVGGRCTFAWGSDCNSGVCPSQGG